MSLRAIAYISEAAPEMPHDRLDAIVEDAARFNRVAGVTGVLLYDGARFLQYVEGPEDGIASVYERIVQASGHSSMTRLAGGSVPARYFPYWSMRWLPSLQTELDQLAHSDWAGFARTLDDTVHGTRASGIALLEEMVQPLVQVG